MNFYYRLNHRRRGVAPTLEIYLKFSASFLKFWKFLGGFVRSLDLMEFQNLQPCRS